MEDRESKNTRQIKKKSNFLAFLYNPWNIFVICIFFSLLNLFLRKTPMRLWKVKKEHKKILQEKTLLEKKTNEIKEKIKKASSLEFVEREAKNRLDLAKKGELIFIFYSDDKKISKKKSNSSQEKN